MVYVLNKEGTPLMPSSRYRHFKKLIQEGKAKKISSKPFVVQLLYETQNQVQPLILGIDPGRTNIGLSVVTESGTPVFEAEVQTRNKAVSKLMKERKGFRITKHRSYGRRKMRIRRAIKAGTTTKQPCTEQKQINKSKSVGVLERLLPGYDKPVRCLGIKNKEARFNNRKRPEGWLTLTARHLLQTHINAVLKIAKFLPISNIVLELNQFAFMAMDNPNIKRWEYQRGPLYKQGSLHEAVFAQQDGKCLLCDAPIDRYHHVIPKHLGGSDTIDNIAGLCSKHHSLVHTDSKTKALLATKKAGMNKKYHALSVLNQILPYLVEELNRIIPVTTVSGKDTYRFRTDHLLPKEHFLDAYCIACLILPNVKIAQVHEEAFRIRQFRRHDRQACNTENLNRRYLKDGKVVATNRHKATEQYVDSLEEYVAKGGKTDTLSVKPHPATYKNMDRIMPGAFMSVDGNIKVMIASRGLHNGKPDYYVFSDGTKATPKHCVCTKHNSGLVFV